ncbi:MAG: VasL domain-containing protein [Silvania sp.]|uniref:VasL domain-containing protein n=1 Tax=Silvania sp. TaxID=3016633 RepID=UPI003EE44872
MGPVNNPETLKTGGDPRALPDYIALRHELAKLSHPARPDVGWNRVEQLSLSLFRQNGVELETACGYTLARTRLSGITGLNEGLAILEALLMHQWQGLWPQAVPVRVALLKTLSTRLQQMLRTLTLAYSDQDSLHQTEQYLSRMGQVLQRLELEPLTQFDTLLTMLRNAAARVKHDESVTGRESQTAQEIALPAGPAMPPEPPKWVYVAQPASEGVTPRAAAAKPWRAFAAGMCTMLLISGVLAWSWQSALKPAPDLQGQQQLNAAAITTENLNGWHQGMVRLQQLADRLNALDEKRGQYITVSELKSATFDMLTHFRQAEPTEDRLRKIQLLPDNSAARQQQVYQTEQYLRAQMAVLMQEKARTAAAN